MSPTLTRTTLDVLRDARDLLTPPERWTKGSFAQDSKGLDVSEVSEFATCFCGLGALRRAAGPGHMGLAFAAEAPLLKAVAKDPRAQGSFRSQSYPRFNDHPATTHADVLASFDRAIASEVKDAA